MRFEVRIPEVQKNRPGSRGAFSKKQFEGMSAERQEWYIGAIDKYAERGWWVESATDQPPPDALPAVLALAQDTCEDGQLYNGPYHC